jgi:hypothetical protein
MKLLTTAAALATLFAVGSQGALAFTYENQGTTQPSAAPSSGAKAGYVDVDPGSLLPPIGESVPGQTYDFGPGAFNNGMASQPTRNDSVGPGWLYPPR